MANPCRRQPCAKDKLNRLWKTRATPWSVSQNCPTLINCSAYKRTNTFAQHSFRDVRLNYELGLVRDLKQAPKKSFAYARQDIALRLESSRVLKPDSSLSASALESASIFDYYFATVFRSDDHCHSPPIVILDPFKPELEIATSMVSALLDCLPVHKSAGSTGIHTQLLKIWHCFSLCKIPITGVLPSDWQTATDSREKFKIWLYQL